MVPKSLGYEGNTWNFRMISSWLLSLKHPQTQRVTSTAKGRTARLAQPPHTGPNVDQVTSPGPWAALGPFRMLLLTQVDMSAPPALCCPLHLSIQLPRFAFLICSWPDSGHLLPHSMCRRGLSSPSAQRRLQKRGRQKQGLWDWSPAGLVHRPFLCPLLTASSPQAQIFLVIRTAWFLSNSRTSGRQSESEFPGE